MGINNRVFELLTTHCKTGGKALAAGYPDILVDEATIARICGDIAADAHSDEIRRYHKKDVAPRDACAVFRAIGYELDVIDIYQHRGCERIVDLNYQAELGQYDLVIDHGTIEHCFNIGVASMNLAGAVKPGGMIVQHLPMSMFNHGFYNLNPTWFWSFYPQNGFNIVHFEGMAEGQTFAPPEHQRFKLRADDGLLTMIAQRVSGEALKLPIQERYNQYANRIL